LIHDRDVSRTVIEGPVASARLKWIRKIFLKKIAEGVMIAAGGYIWDRLQYLLNIAQCRVVELYDPIVFAASILHQISRSQNKCFKQWVGIIYVYYRSRNLIMGFSKELRIAVHDEF
jgi:hypothetical protein